MTPPKGYVRVKDGMTTCKDIAIRNVTVTVSVICSVKSWENCGWEIYCKRKKEK